MKLMKLTEKEKKNYCEKKFFIIDGIFCHRSNMAKNKCTPVNEVFSSFLLKKEDYTWDSFSDKKYNPEYISSQDINIDIHTHVLIMSICDNNGKKKASCWVPVCLYDRDEKIFEERTKERGREFEIFELTPPAVALDRHGNMAYKKYIYGRFFEANTKKFEEKKAAFDEAARKEEIKKKSQPNFPGYNWDEDEAWRVDFEIVSSPYSPSESEMTYTAHLEKTVFTSANSEKEEEEEEVLKLQKECHDKYEEEQNKKTLENGTPRNFSIKYFSEALSAMTEFYGKESITLTLKEIISWVDDNVSQFGEIIGVGVKTTLGNISYLTFEISFSENRRDLIEVGTHDNKFWEDCADDDLRDALEGIGIYRSEHFARYRALAGKI